MFLHIIVLCVTWFGIRNHFNLLSGIGADDAFIYCKIWQTAKLEKVNATVVKLVNDTLSHSVVSMFVTSVTTAAAFYSSSFSSITAISCFRLVIFVNEMLFDQKLTSLSLFQHLRWNGGSSQFHFDGDMVTSLRCDRRKNVPNTYSNTVETWNK